MKHPSYMGKFINKYIYDALPDGVLDELKRRLPKNDHGNRRATLAAPTRRHGHSHRQPTSTMTLLYPSEGKDESIGTTRSSWNSTGEAWRSVKVCSRPHA